MNKSWWVSEEDLDKDQKEFIQLPPSGKHSLVGPPGSGKTNLLLLRAQFISGSGKKNVIVITYTNMLKEFIRSGISEKSFISQDQIQTYHSWAVGHINEYLGQQPIPDDHDFNNDTRKNICQLLQQANDKLPTPKLYDAIFVDEAQDFTIDELDVLLSLSDNVCICGDNKQGIYNNDGLDIAKKLDFKQHELTKHYRIGQKIAHVADKFMPPVNSADALESTSNYNPKTEGKSSANIHLCESRDEQFEKMLSLIKIQLEAFKDEPIGVFCGSKELRAELKKRFDDSRVSSLVCVHGVDDIGFSNSHPIHVLTFHSSKGTEFRAVHIFGAEQMQKFPFRRTTLVYTALTRAKTALNVFVTGSINPRLDSAFSEPKQFGLGDLFEGNS